MEMIFQKGPIMLKDLTRSKNVTKGTLNLMGGNAVLLDE